MIKLTKLKCPDVLSKNKERWTAELMSYVDKYEKPPPNVASRYNNPEIKSVLKKETHGKCAYCESHFEHVAFGDIEHIKPKAKYPQLTFEWQNLTCACQQCNNNKRDEYDENCPPIDPYVDDPGAFLKAVGPFIRPQNGNKKGEQTETLLKLNRKPLWENRKRRIRYLKACLFDKYFNETDEDKRKALLSEIREEIAETKEYSFCLKSFFEQMHADH